VLVKAFFFSTIRAEPPEASPDPVLSPVEPSTLAVQVNANLSALIQRIEQTVPKDDIKAGAWTVVGKFLGQDVGEKHIIRRDAIALSVTGNQFSGSTTVHYWLKVAFCAPKPWPLSGCIFAQVASCGVGPGPDGNEDPQNKAGIQLISAITINPNYQVTSSTKGDVQILTPCQLTDFKYSLDGKIKALFQNGLNSAAALIDQQVPQLTNGPARCAIVWQNLQSPLAVAQGIWLAVNAASFKVSQVSGSGNNVSVNLGLTAHPEIVFGDQPSSQSSPVPPKLDTGAAGNLVHIVLPVDILFDEASSQINQGLSGRVYPIGPYKVEIKKAEVYGSGRTLARDRGAKVGRPTKLSPHQQQEIIRTVRDGSKTAGDAARLFGRHRSSITRLLARAVE
jgi:hypothetical protein